MEAEEGMSPFGEKAVPLDFEDMVNTIPSTKID
jgi:hypothetical protein